MCSPISKPGNDGRTSKRDRDAEPLQRGHDEPDKERHDDTAHRHVRGCDLCAAVVQYINEVSVRGVEYGGDLQMSFQRE
jgi:hypothetical protein